MSTHRCKKLLEHNKNYKFGSPMCIKYGYQFDNPYNEKKRKLQRLVVKLS